jgi:putative IMPACT (imprinted ancient) family translation regulator
MSARQVLTAAAFLTQNIRKSTFSAHAAIAPAPDVALSLVETMSDVGATHNCWAYRIGQSYRCNDDGEPSGTAGKPILQAIDAQHIDHVVVVVTRWYGGIKLGTGGLARAYGGCAAECLRLATKAPLIECATVELALPFAALPLLHARLDEFAATTLDERFIADGAHLRIALPADRVDALRTLVADATRGRGRFDVLD